MQVATEIASFTCICCPLGCPLEVSFDERGEVADVSGNTCARGAAYAVREATASERMVTAVVCAAGCLEPLSVKTARPVPKERVAEVLAACLSAQVEAPVAEGAVVIADVCSTGVDVVATKSVP